MSDAEILAELRRINERLDAMTPKVEPLILTRQEAAAVLRISVRQLQRLVRTGRVVSLPSGIAKTELERYARTPQTPLPKPMTRPMALRSAKDEADRLTDLLKARSKRR